MELGGLEYNRCKVLNMARFDNSIGLAILLAYNLRPETPYPFTRTSSTPTATAIRSLTPTPTSLPSSKPQTQKQRSTARQT